ncbi:MAG: hypothetical protein GW772_03635 [Flavobacteriia bacterium]|nr:hypothetical protein [Flavobacteriia bacterium]OIP46650.1 MAG: hypothetical protein AUK46_07410 [Flavobacteriaceae bacterium CG2_30_31_66]PIV97950.1 MAG: hypothetical protein COW43_00635 [Flavobacteriaceae bacterium CG17_big_fil_post_rev_8_21_14_2_50_31_13]PIX11724.1 MAG: hypothetical protein COZ74_13460 [Flavobacteriaceae bacterium CG_4_8_14_3_um_filter_31_8]PIY16225.1 MAG: hypothetical protein COZ16_01315 [Flavobacteriaceae bacterium CG_4_10_14_3_um_filter_31_253]PIZ11222.1 MAG: hypotheti
MKKILLVAVVFTTSLFSQNKQVLYDFADLPQTLLLNPGLENSYKFHVGVPLISGISTQFGSTGVVLNDLFAIDNQNINNKVSTVLQSLTTKDFVQMNTQIEILNVGYRLNEKTYLSGGFYQEIDAIGYYPKDLVILFSEGNDAYLNKSFSASQINYKLDVLGVLHAGITRKVNEKLTVGGRFKIYSAALNIESTNNSGTFTTVLGADNIYRHYLSNVKMIERSAGLIDGNKEFITKPETYLKNTFLKGDLGVGFDIGITYHIDKQLQFSASILDFGFINHSKNIKNYKEEGNFVFDGFEFQFDEDSNVDYWQQINNRFKKQLPTTENEDSYVSWRPAKINMALKYSFGEKRSEVCYDNSYQDFYTDAIGAQLFTVFRPLNPQLALTAFYQKSFTKKLHGKVTYTIDEFSAYNFGLGLSAQLGKVNFYGMFDNLLAYRNLASANSLSLQLGLNILFN